MNIDTYISSGVLERYCCGQLSEAETSELLGLLELHPRLQVELERVERSLETYSIANAVEPPSGLADKVLHRIGLTSSGAANPGVQKKTKGGTTFNFPIFDEDTDVEELRRIVSAVPPPEKLDNLSAKVLSVGEERTYLLLWVRKFLPEEMHTDLVEKLAVLQGQCIGFLEGEPHDLKAGDFFTIPPGKHHHLSVTSEEPCLLLIERTALAA